MENPTIALKPVTYPAIGFPKEPRPELSTVIYQKRIARLRQAMRKQHLDLVIVYGDREHFANLAWLTNYDPRFEEALLLVYPTGKPILFAGNEGMAYSHVARLPMDRRLYQTFSLLGQPRESVRDFSELLKEAGVPSAKHIGVAGWKYFSSAEFPNPETVLDLPEFIASSIRRAAPRAQITNRTDIFMHAETGLRSLLETEQIADFEWVATANSESLLQGLRKLRAGLTENEACANMGINGLPFSAHPVVVTGEKFLRCFMPSPTSKKILRGEPCMMTCSYQGANTCRMGWIARGKQDLPASLRPYEDRVAAPYFLSLVRWYEALKIGATGGAIHDAVHTVTDPLGFKIGLNAGHQIATDEWTHSFIESGSKQKVRSAMYFQADYMPMSGTPLLTSYAEDGVVVADQKLRVELAQEFPTAWRRFQKRRAFMAKTLGIQLPEELLPMSNFPAAVIPYLLTPDSCMVLS